MRLAIILVFLLFFAVQTRRRPMSIPSARSRRVKAFSGFGRAMASLWKNGFRQSEEEVSLSGKQMQAEVNKMKLHDEMLDNNNSFWTVILLSVGGVMAILCFIMRRNRQEDVDIDYERIREKRVEREKRDRLLDALHQHGVHPDRANGSIYRIRL